MKKKVIKTEERRLCRDISPVDFSELNTDEFYEIPMHRPATEEQVQESNHRYAVLIERLTKEK